MKRYSLCPICGDEKLHETRRNVLREFEGFKKEVAFHTSACESCGSETLTEKQATFNKRQMTDFYREADGLLTGNQIKAFRENMHLTQAQAAKVFGGGKNAFTKYENGDVTQSVAMDKLIRTAASVPQALEFLHHGCPEVTAVTYTTSYEDKIYRTLFDKAPIMMLSPLKRVKSANVELQMFQFEGEPVSNNWEDSFKLMLG